jgi:hypothetical protein
LSNQETLFFSSVSLLSTIAPKSPITIATQRRAAPLGSTGSPRFSALVNSRYSTEETLPPIMQRSESLAYPKTGTWSKLQYLARQNSRAFVATLAFVAFVLILTLDSVQRESTGVGVGHKLRNL